MSSEFGTALAGAFTGAAAAFLFQAAWEHKKQRDSEHSAIIEAQMALIAQWNHLATIQKQYLEPYRSSSDRHVEMVHYSATDPLQRINFGAIAFLLKEAEPNLILEMQLAEQSYRSAIDAIEQRNLTYLRFGERAKVANFHPDQISTGKVSLLSEHPLDLIMLKSQTDLIFEATERALVRIEKAFMKFLTEAQKRDYGKRLFKVEQFMPKETAKPKYPVV